MIYTDGVLIFFGLSLLLYLILGGADFGAGILELFMGDKGVSTVYRAIAPVWEANHMWLIIAVVILFNGFPSAYALVSTALHIPIMMVLVGIILRGTAFTFRHYDAVVDGSQLWYSRVFRYSSAFTVFSLGLVIGPMISGTIPASIEGQSFADYYIFPWLNGFSISIGLFTMVISAYIAAVYLLGEVRSESGDSQLTKATRYLALASVISGVGIFIFSYISDVNFHNEFLGHPMSLVSLGLATLLAPLMYVLIKRKSIWLMRIGVSAQMAFILAGLAFIQLPYIIHLSDGVSLSIYDTTAPTATMRVLFWSLMIGVCFIVPALVYLLIIFKRRANISPPSP